jgi:hypothetical protein
MGRLRQEAVVFETVFLELWNSGREGGTSDEFPTSRGMNAAVFRLTGGSGRKFPLTAEAGRLDKARGSGAGQSARFIV